MLSCKKGIVTLDGTDSEIETDLTVLIHAVDRTYIKRFGKEKAKARVKRCYDMAMDDENRDFGTDDEIEGSKAEVISKALKNIEKLLNEIIGESEEDK